jgi:hypothetical protein
MSLLQPGLLPSLIAAARTKDAPFCSGDKFSSERWTCILAVVVNKSQFPEPVHEETDSRADCSLLHSIAFGDERSYGFQGAVLAAKPAALL